ncbi:MAG: hypothetical protein JXB30_01310 [Anaerolineae bacterium]|nr:hypothetical protein [Anaerolineae bacterium]
MFTTGNYDPPGANWAFEIFHIDLETDEVSFILPPDKLTARNITLDASPDGRYIAVADENSIALLSTDTSVWIPDIFTYELITTETEAPGLAHVRWLSDSTGFWAVVPEIANPAGNKNERERFAALGGSPYQIWYIPLNTLRPELQIVTPPLNPVGYGTHVQLSPDGHYLAYDPPGATHMLNLDTFEDISVPFSKNVHDLWWDGSSQSLLADIGNQYHDHTLYRVKLDGSYEVIELPDVPCEP